MVGFVYRLESNDQRFQTNGTVRANNYKKMLLFPMRDFVSFGTYHQQVFYILNRFFKNNLQHLCTTISIFLHSQQK